MGLGYWPEGFRASLDLHVLRGILVFAVVVVHGGQLHARLTEWRGVEKKPHIPTKRNDNLFVCEFKKEKKNDNNNNNKMMSNKNERKSKRGLVFVPISGQI